MSHRTWLQVNVSVSRVNRGGISNARAVFELVMENLPDWRRHHAISGFFFMRKPPDLRLRFEGTDPAKTVLPALRRGLRTLTGAGRVVRFFPSVYEPESDLFGGAPAMRLVHRYFDADSMGWVALDRLAQSGKLAVLSDTAVSVAVLNDLFVKAGLDRSELWDAWRNLVKLTHVRGVTQDHDTRPALILLDSLLPTAAPGEAHILTQYAHANAALGGGLLRLWGQGRLNAGLRAILAFVGLFHLNRFGYGPARGGALASTMAAVWDPRADLLGWRDAGSEH
jgi:thiopeptide-type bacteriocin biosynthesis protein